MTEKAMGTSIKDGWESYRDTVPSPLHSKAVLKEIEQAFLAGVYHTLYSVSAELPQPATDEQARCLIGVVTRMQTLEAEVVKRVLEQEQKTQGVH